MSKQNESDQQQSFKTLLERLQQDSWQLELLISGFVIFLLIGAEDALKDVQQYVEYLDISFRDNQVVKIPMIFLYLVWVFLMFNLILHVFLRGLWISTIGLRYISGDIDYSVLQYRPKFGRYLKKRMGSFDGYIERLENFCSIIFAFTFLIVFAFISMAIFLIVLFTVGRFSKNLGELWVGDGGFWPFRIPMITLLIFGFVYFIDFISQGFFKKIRWIAPVYFPIYRLMSLITMSFLYRPMYYNLIDNRFGKRVGFLIVPYIIFALIAFSINFHTHPFYPETNIDLHTFNDQRYVSKLDEHELIRMPVIEDRYVKDGYLETFLPYIPIHHDSVLTRICPDIIPIKENRMYTSVIQIDLDETENVEVLQQQTFECLTRLFRLEVNDSIHQAPTYYLYEFDNYQGRGLKSILDIDYLDRGPHELKVYAQFFKTKVEGDSLYWHKIATIPFWKT